MTAFEMLDDNVANILIQFIIDHMDMTGHTPSELMSKQVTSDPKELVRKLMTGELGKTSRGEALGLLYMATTDNKYVMTILVPTSDEKGMLRMSVDTNHKYKGGHEMLFSIPLIHTINYTTMKDVS